LTWPGLLLKVHQFSGLIRRVDATN
jgi:hypothetical protein